MSNFQGVIGNIKSRVVLREVQESDWQFVQAMRYSEQPDFSSHLQSEADCQRYIQQFLAQQVQNPRQQYRFMIVVKEAHQLIGWCDLYLQTGGAELGYRIDSNHCGQGYATEAVKLLIEYAFSELKVNLIWAETQLQNPASMRVLEKVGMQQQSVQSTGTVYYRLERQVWHYDSANKSRW